MPTLDVTRTYLELPAGAPLTQHPIPAGFALHRAKPCTPELYRQLYGGVGAQYHWIDRSRWTDAQIEAHLARPDVSIWILREGESIAGWFELVDSGEGSTEIAYFGLFPEYHGRGLGRVLLCEAVAAARQTSPRVWLHTCTLDAPAALPNYLARGFRPFREEVYQATLPE